MCCHLASLASTPTRRFELSQPNRGYELGEPKLKRQLVEWRHPDSPTPKKFQQRPSSVKPMIIAAYDHTGIILSLNVPRMWMLLTTAIAWKFTWGMLYEENGPHLNLLILQSWQHDRTKGIQNTSVHSNNWIGKTYHIEMSPTLQFRQKPLLPYPISTFSEMCVVIQ